MGCENSHKPFIKSKTIFRPICHRGGEEYIPYLLCMESQRVSTSNEIISEYFTHITTKFNEPDFDISHDGEQRFIYQGLVVNLYNRKINEPYDIEYLDYLAFWIDKYYFEVA